MREQHRADTVLVHNDEYLLAGSYSLLRKGPEEPYYLWIVLLFRVQRSALFLQLVSTNIKGGLLSSSPLPEGSSINNNQSSLQSKCLEKPFSNYLITRHLMMHWKQHSLPPRRQK